jgi:hypothetical protein
MREMNNPGNRRPRGAPTKNRAAPADGEALKGCGKRVALLCGALRIAPCWMGVPHGDTCIKTTISLIAAWDRPPFRSEKGIRRIDNAAKLA